MHRLGGRRLRATFCTIGLFGTTLVGPTSGISTAETIETGSTSVQQMIDADLRLRAQLGLPIDPALVESFYVGDVPNRDMGAAFTSAERAEVQARQSLGGDLAVIHRYVAEHQLDDVFGGAFVDNARGGLQVALFCDGAASHEDLLVALVPHPSRLDVRPCTHSSQHLDAVLAALSAELVELRRQGLTIPMAWVDVVTNSVVASVSSPDLATAELLLRTRFGQAIRVVAGEQAEQLSGGPSRDADTEPFVAGDALLSPLGPCTLGFAANGHFGATYSLTAGHCDDTLGGSNDHFNGATKVGNTIGTTVNSAIDALWMYDTAARSALVYTNFPSALVVRDSDSGHEQVGYTRCMSGAKTQYHCGTLASTNATVGPRPEYPTVVMTNQRLVDDTASRGDSGAPAWHPLSGYAYASGMLHTGVKIAALDPNSPPTGCPTCPYYYRIHYAYTPILRALNSFGLTLGTG